MTQPLCRSTPPTQPSPCTLLRDENNLSATSAFFAELFSLKHVPDILFISHTRYALTTISLSRTRPKQKYPSTRFPPPPFKSNQSMADLGQDVSNLAVKMSDTSKAAENPEPLATDKRDSTCCLRNPDAAPDRGSRAAKGPCECPGKKEEKRGESGGKKPETPEETLEFLRRFVELW